MSASTSASRPRSAAEAALKVAAGLWFLVAVVGQWTFVYYIAARYGTSTLSGDLSGWDRRRLLFKAFVPGDAAGNLFFGAHVLLASIVVFGGALQLVPQLRTRALSFHRWNGRLFLLAALGTALAGLYLVWVRGNHHSVAGALANSLNAVLIILFAALAWRSAFVREIHAHRRWALRSYLVANGQWFIRVGLFGWLFLNGGRPVGMTDRFDGPVDYVMGFACYLVPLAVLELYLRAKDSTGPRGRYAMAGALLALTALTGVGIWGVYSSAWRPSLTVTAPAPSRRSSVGR